MPFTQSLLFVSHNQELLLDSDHLTIYITIVIFSSGNHIVSFIARNLSAPPHLENKVSQAQDSGYPRRLGIHPYSNKEYPQDCKQLMTRDRNCDHWRYTLDFNITKDPLIFGDMQF